MSDYNRGQPRPQDGVYRTASAGWQPSGEPGFLTEDPAQLGAQMQQGGVPLYPNAEDHFYQQGSNAPTRVGRPVTIPQAAQPVQAEEAQTDPVQPRRRRSRVAERAQREEGWQNESAQPIPEAQPMQRPVEPRYQQVRTTVSQSTQQPATARPAQRPAAAPRQMAQRPQQMSQRVAQNPQQGQPRPAQQRVAQDGNRPARRPADEAYRRQQPPVERYEAEEEDEEDTGRRGGVLLPIVVILLVIGGLLAGLCLPKWENMGEVGKKIAPIQQQVIGLFDKVKGMIRPEEEALKSFDAVATGNTAPTQVQFTVQTAKDVEAIRIIDDEGNTVYRGVYAPGDEGGDVIANSNVLYWQPSYTVEDAYIGSYTVFTTRKGQESETGLPASSALAIAAPKAEEPPVSAFSCDTSISAVPARVTFSITTSADVMAVRIVDDNNNPLINMFEDSSAEWCSMTEEGDRRVWTLSTEILGAYTGSYLAQYMIGDSMNYTPSGYSVAVQLGTEPIATMPVMVTATPAPTPVPVEETPTPTPTPTATPTPSPTPSPTPTPTPSPTPSPVPTPTPVPTTPPLPELSAEASGNALPETIKLTSTVYSGSKVLTSFQRAKPISMLNAFTSTVGGSDYAVWRQAGVLTFRSGPLRQNAAYSTADVTNAKMTVMWNQPIGGMKVEDTTVYGVNAPGQPVIVKWPTELRTNMGLYDAMKEVTALKEVIVAGQDGKVHFYNLLTGEATRDDVDLGAPSRGGLSVATNGTPILGVGQYNGKLANKTVKNGYHIINLITNAKERLIAGDGKDRNSNYGGVTGAALFDSVTGTMIFGAQNGVLYTAEFGGVKDTYNYGLNQVKLSESIQGYKTLMKDQKKTNTNIDASVAMYNHYVYYGDQAGVLQCVDVNTLKPIWALNLEDNLDATPALDVEDEETVALYIGNTVTNRSAKASQAAIYRIDALSGEIEWTFDLQDTMPVKRSEVGCYASPVVGQESISDLVIFTVSYAAEPARMFALDKKTGEAVWETTLESPSVSSPLAVYNEEGDAWLVQAEMNGMVHLMNARTGEMLDTLQLTVEDDSKLEIKASPAAYANLVVIGTTGSKNGGVYCIKID